MNQRPHAHSTAAPPCFTRRDRWGILGRASTPANHTGQQRIPPSNVMHPAGSVAAIKAPQLCELLAQHADVRVVITRSAKFFLAAGWGQALGVPVFDVRGGGGRRVLVGSARGAYLYRRDMCTAMS